MFKGTPLPFFKPISHKTHHFYPKSPYFYRYESQNSRKLAKYSQNIEIPGKILTFYATKKPCFYALNNILERDKTLLYSIKMH